MTSYISTWDIFTNVKLFTASLCAADKCLERQKHSNTQCSIEITSTTASNLFSQSSLLLFVSVRKQSLVSR